MTTTNITSEFDNYAKTQIEEAFKTMIRFEMLVSGKSWDEAKEVVKEHFRKNNLL